MVNIEKLKHEVGSELSFRLEELTRDGNLDWCDSRNIDEVLETLMPAILKVLADG